MCIPRSVAIHENISINPHDLTTPEGRLLSGRRSHPYGAVESSLKTNRPNDTTYFYGFGGGADFLLPNTSTSAPTLSSCTCTYSALFCRLAQQRAPLDRPYLQLRPQRKQVATRLLALKGFVAKGSLALPCITFELIPTLLPAISCPSRTSPSNSVLRAHNRSRTAVRFCAASRTACVQLQRLRRRDRSH